MIGDPVRVRQILVNLVGNAVKFTDSGYVRVAVTAEGEGGGVSRLHFTVTDTGIGIPPEKHGKIFEAFQQADGSVTRKYGGSGLGLAISARLALLMNGGIWLESTSGAGSTFHFAAEFPLPPNVKGANGDVASRAAAAVTEPPPRRLTVLVVEDNQVNQKVLTRMLAKQGHEIVLAENGRAAIAEASRREFDLILMDVQMPVLDGLAATRAIRSREQGTGHHVPILALTAHAMKGDRERCLEAGMDGYVAKPVNLPELTNAIRQVVPQDQGREA
jgi:CheY-like chemotaxis protein